MKENRYPFDWYQNEYHNLDDTDGDWVVDKFIYGKEFAGNMKEGYKGHKGEPSEHWFKVKFQFLDHVKIEPSFNVLEGGCGDGKIIIPVAMKYPANYWACDISPNGITKAKRNMKTAQESGVLNKDIVFSVQKIQEMDYPDEFFDRVFVFGVLEHFGDEDYYAALHAVKRVMKKSGILYLHSPWREIDGGMGRVSQDIRHLHVNYQFF